MKEHTEEHMEDYENRIRASIEREAEEMDRRLEEKLKKYPELRDMKPSDSLDERIFAEIDAYEAEVAKRKKEKAADEDALALLSEEDKEALRLGRELLKRRREEEEQIAVRKRSNRWTRIVAAIAVLVLAGGIGVTSVGGPKRVVEIVKTTFGGRETSRVNSGTGEVKETEDPEENQAYQKIRDELGFDPVKIIMIPGDMKFKYFEIDTDILWANFLYSIHDRNISYIIEFVLNVVAIFFSMYKSKSVKKIIFQLNHLNFFV